MHKELNSGFFRLIVVFSTDYVVCVSTELVTLNPFAKVVQSNMF